MSDTIIVLGILAVVCVFFFFLINRDVHKVEKDYYNKQRSKKKARA